MTPRQHYPSATDRARAARGAASTALAALAMVALLAFCSDLPAQSLFERPGAGLSRPSAQVETRLLADVTAVEAGRPFRLGVLFKMIPGWHIYWRYAGEVGIPTRIEWELPVGFTAGELQWPNPRRIDDPEAGLVSYGWDGEVLLFLTITPPAELAAGSTLTFKTRNNWLACEVQCVPGSSTNDLSLPVAPSAPSADAPLFDQFAGLVPVGLPASPVPLRAEFTPSDAELEAGGTLEQRLRVEALPPWKLLLATEGFEGRLLPDATSQLTTSHPTVAEGEGEAEQAGGDLAYAALSFDWSLKSLEDTPPGDAMLRPVLELPALNTASGSIEQLRLILDRPLRLKAAAAPESAPPAASGEVPTARAAEPGTSAPADGSFAFRVERSEQARPLAVLLLFAFLGGLLLNVMPCVLPVLSIKILGFVNQAREDPRRILRSGLVFALGVYASFFALAILVVAVKAAGSEIGWGFQLQEPRFVVLITAAIFAFGLSLFGVFTIDLPGAAGSGLASAAGRKGPAGDFLNGVLATVLATPCTAPLLGPALGFAFAQPPAQIVLFFLVIATGLAFPYVLLSARPGWLRFVPKPGLWMEHFKHAMGVLLMATVVWLLWVLGKQAGSDGIIAALSFLLAVGVACALLGWGFDLSAGPSRRSLAGAAALALIALGYFLFPERQLRRLAALPESAVAAPGAAADASGGDGEIAWKPFSVEAVNALVAQDKTVFVDFTADWCLTCKVNERTVLSTTAVREAFRKYKVEALVADYTRRQPEITKILHDFGRAGVPMYVIFPAGRPESYMLLPEVLTPALVIEKLEEASKPVAVARVDEARADSPQ